MGRSGRERERERATQQREGKSSYNVGGRERVAAMSAVTGEQRESVERERVEEEKK
jgi:hypothetical protein